LCRKNLFQGICKVLNPFTKGKAAAVVQDATSYQRLLDLAAHADAREGIRQGLEEAKAGKGQDADAFFAEFEAEHGISG
jgi:hypothetical protein